jgi:hypothetical protein
MKKQILSYDNSWNGLVAEQVAKIKPMNLNIYG